MSQGIKNREVIFEFRPIGNIMRVAAVDVATGIEAVVQCPLSAGEGVFKKIGLQKLEYVLLKKRIIQ